MSPLAGRFLGRDPIGYYDGLSLYGNYFGLEKVDSEGTCANGCSCIVEELDIFPTEADPKIMTGLMKNGQNFYGNAFIVTIRLRYEKNDTGAMEPCTLCWGENTDFITSPNEWGLVKNQWKNLYSVYSGNGKDEHLGQFKSQNDKFMSGEQACPGTAEITVTDTPALAKTGRGFFGTTNVTAKRRLSFFIRATSGKKGAGSKSATAQQFLNIAGGDLKNDSYFKSPGEGLPGWPKDSFDSCEETASGKVKEKK
jgi:hypothetical protein